jgi:DNA-binding MarR family transcriptional regulator
MASADLKGAYRDRQAWMENLIADRTLSRGELAVAMCLAFHKNLTSGQCNPSLDRIAKRTGMKVRGAQHALSSLESRGWIKRQIGGRGPRSTT